MPTGKLKSSNLPPRAPNPVLRSLGRCPGEAVSSIARHLDKNAPHDLEVPGVHTENIRIEVCMTRGAWSLPEVLYGVAVTKRACTLAARYRFIRASYNARDAFSVTLKPNEMRWRDGNGSAMQVSRLQNLFPRIQHIQTSRLSVQSRLARCMVSRVPMVGVWNAATYHGMIRCLTWNAMCE
jgi:hypothetical protein